MARLIHIFLSFTSFGVFVFSFEYDVFRNSPNDVWIYDIDPEKCYEECRKRSGCVSVNLHTETHTCLINMDLQRVKETQHGFVYSEKATWEVAATPGCQAAQCPTTQVCITGAMGVTCEYRECPVPSPVANGQILGNQRFVGARINVMCDVNHVLIGPKSLTCKRNGLWEESTDQIMGVTASYRCLGGCPYMSVIQNGRRNGNAMTEGSTIVYVCDDGYTMIGPSNITCQPDGTWTSDYNGSVVLTPPECYPECPDPSPVTNGQVLGNQRFVGARIEIVCDDNYVLIGPTTLTCKRNGLWEKTTDPIMGVPVSYRCLRGCPYMSEIQNGRKNGSAMTEGSKIAYLCDDGYTLIGPSNMTCQPDGTWTSDYNGSVVLTPPECVPGCPYMSEIQNGKRNGNTMTEGSTIAYVCDDGYAVRGPPNMTCHPGGTWTSDHNGSVILTPPECIPACKYPPDIDNGERIGDEPFVNSSVTYSCLGSYKLVGPSTFLCAESKNWTVVAPCSVNSHGDDLMTSPPRCLQENCVVKNESAYQVHSQATNWSAAANICAENGGHLVSFSCEAEYLLVRQILQQSELKVFFTGLNDLDRACYWNWHNSTEEFTYQNWGPIEPNNLGNQQRCGVVALYVDYLMDDSPCSRSRSFICEN